MEEEHCGDQGGSLCQHQPTAGSPSLQGLCLQDGWKRPIPEEGLALWRRGMRSKMRGEETCC